MADSSAIIAALVLAGGGLLASYVRLRIEYEPTIAALAAVLLAGASPLSRSVTEGHVIDAALYLGLSLLALVVSARITDRVAAAAILGVGVLAVALVAPEVTPRPTLFAAPAGFLSLTPVVYVAVVGAMLALRRHLAEGLAALLALTLWPWLQTPLVPSLAFLAAGLAAVIAWLQRRPLAAALPLVVGAIVWNYWLMVQYTVGWVPKDAPVSFASMVRQQADVHTRPPYIYPFAFPGNLVAAWREGVPLSRYDVLAAEPRAGEFEMRFDGGADRFLLDGWGPLGTSSAGPYRTIAADQADLVFPFDAAGAHRVDVVIVATLRGADSPQLLQVDVRINGQGVGRASVTPMPAEAHVNIPADVVGQIFHAGYNRLSIVSPQTARIAVHRLRIARLND